VSRVADQSEALKAAKIWTPTLASAHCRVPVVTVSVAVNCARHGEDEITEWFSVAAVGKTGDALARHAKGDLVAIMGVLTRTSFTGRDGARRQGWSITAVAIVSARTVRPSGGKQKQSLDEASSAGGPASDLDDEIPF
jgi:single-stranded DNA-binding protein